MSFDVGDIVEVVAPGVVSHGAQGNIVSTVNGRWPYHVLFDGEHEPQSALFDASELKIVSDRPSVEVRETIVVKFGNDEHEMTRPEAYALFRALDRALDSIGS